MVALKVMDLEFVLVACLLKFTSVTGLNSIGWFGDKLINLKGCTA
jgi:hypothetical protein